MNLNRAMALAATSIAGLSPTFALAHHGIDGRTPTTFAEGLISGLAHPVLGLDHLVFLLAAGLAAGALRLGLGIVNCILDHENRIYTRGCFMDVSECG